MPDRYGRVVTPIYFGTHDGRLDFEGSGVLLKSRASCWLFTAAHVLAASKGRPTILPGPPGRFVQLTNLPGASCKLDPTVAANDPIDLAYVRLSEQESKMMTEEGLSFLQVSPDKIDARKSSQAGARCMVTGYPDNPGVYEENRGVKINHEKRVCEVTQLSLDFVLFRTKKCSNSVSARSSILV